MSMNPFSTEVEPISMDGFQVVSGEYFSYFNRYATPSCTIWSGGITFNKVSLTALNNCERICFLLAQDGKTLLMQPHKNRDFISHKVPREVYESKRSFEISSCNLCRILADIHGWDSERSYRAPGRIAGNSNGVLFFLDKAELISV